MHVEELLRGKKDLSPRTLRNVLAVLQCVLSHAVDNDLIQRSPLRGRHRPVVPRREKPVWTPEQVRTILSAAPQAYRCLFTCAALTGVRMGELLALQWKHVDLEKRQIRIEQSLWHGQLIPPKTAASVRTMPIGEMLRKALADHHRNSCHTSSADFIFCKPDGSPHEPTGLRRDVLYPMLDRSGIQRQARSSGFHAFRHAAASFINAQTGNLKLAQKFLGHADLSTTADIYTHTLEKSEQEAADAVERAIFGDLFPVVPELGTDTGNSPKPNEQPVM